jgi:hypothetical protein
MPTGRHRRDENGAQVIVQFIWRHDKTWACLSNLTTSRRIELHQVNVASGWHARFLSPLPFFLVEPCGRWRIQKTIFVSLTHFPSCICPPSARPASSADHNPTWLGVKFNFVGELRLL